MKTHTKKHTYIIPIYRCTYCILLYYIAFDHLQSDSLVMNNRGIFVVRERCEKNAREECVADCRVKSIHKEGPRCKPTHIKNLDLDIMEQRGRSDHRIAEGEAE